jgi:DNA-binding response OmpR family regulator
MTKVLLVEDDNNLREIYEARMQAEGYEVYSAHDGEEALVVAKAQLPDLIISDVMMPRISGFEMLDIIRNTEGLKDVKVIMLTALGQNEDQKRAENLGANRYLVKSQVTLEDIVKVANELLSQNNAEIDNQTIQTTDYSQSLNQQNDSAKTTVPSEGNESPDIETTVPSEGMENAESNITSNTLGQVPETTDTQATSSSLAQQIDQNNYQDESTDNQEHNDQVMDSAINELQTDTAPIKASSESTDFNFNNQETEAYQTQNIDVAKQDDNLIPKNVPTEQNSVINDDSENLNLTPTPETESQERTEIEEKIDNFEQAKDIDTDNYQSSTSVDQNPTEDQQNPYSTVQENDQITKNNEEVTELENNLVSEQDNPLNPTTLATPQSQEETTSSAEANQNPIDQALEQNDSNLSQEDNPTQNFTI